MASRRRMKTMSNAWSGTSAPRNRRSSPRWRGSRYDAAALQGQAVAFADPEPWPVTVDLAALLTRVAQFIRRYVVLPAVVADALAAWIAFTYAVKAFAISPYVIVRSPLRRCGKSLLLEVLELLVYRSFNT